MTVIRPNSISGVTSITALANEINVFRHNGVLAGLQLNGVNHHTSAGVSTFHTVNVLGNLDVAGVLTYQDVTNVDSLGIGTFRTGINVSGGQLDVGSNIKLGNAGVITATSFVGDGSNLTGLGDSDKIEEGNSSVEVIDAGTGKIDLKVDGSYTARFQKVTGNRTYMLVGNPQAVSNDYGINSGHLIVLANSGSEPATLRLFGWGAGSSDGTINNRIDFASHQSGSGGQTFAKIETVIRGSNDNSSDMTFHTAASGTVSEALRIASDGHVAITTTGALKVPSGTDAQRPGSPSAGDIRYNSTSTTLEFYNGSVWVGTNAAPYINSVTGTILNGISGRTLVINCNDISASGNDVKYSNNSNGSVIATDTSASTSGSNITSTIPSAVFNTAAGTVIKIEVVNGGGVVSRNSVTTTILGAPSGGNVTTSGSYRIHTFTSSGTFVVPSGVTLSNVEYLIIAGAGGGGGSAQGHQGGGGGAGGLRTSVVGATSGRGSSAESRVTFTAGSYNVSIGAGGVGRASGSGYGGTGVNSGLATPSGTITSNGGGGGGMGQNDGASRGGLNGGCGGGAGSSDQSFPSRASGTSGQGYDGGLPTHQGSGRGGAGGGAGAQGTNPPSGGVPSGNTAGGAGLANSITGSSVTYSTGGDCQGTGGSASAGAANRGNGGTGGYSHGSDSSGKNGSSGVVIVRYIL